MIDLLEKLMEADFKDMFQPAGEEELDKRKYYNEDALIEYFMNIEYLDLLKIYYNYVGPPMSIVKEILGEFSDEVKHRVYKEYVLGRKGDDPEMMTFEDLKIITADEWEKKLKGEVR